MIAYLNGAGFTEVSRGLELRCELYTKNFQEFVKKHGDNSRKVLYPLKQASQIN